MDLWSLWKAAVDRPSMSYSGTRQDKDRINGLDITNPEMNLLIKQYLEETAFPRAQDFADYVESRMAIDDIPLPECCAALLSGHPKLVRIAEEVETLRGAWIPTEETQTRISELRDQLKAAILE